MGMPSLLRQPSMSRMNARWIGVVMVLLLLSVVVTLAVAVSSQIPKVIVSSKYHTNHFPAIFICVPIVNRSQHQMGLI
jgi:hypothetical protein